MHTHSLFFSLSRKCLLNQRSTKTSTARSRSPRRSSLAAAHALPEFLSHLSPLQPTITTTAVAPPLEPFAAVPPPLPLPLLTVAPPTDPLAVPQPLLPPLLAVPPPLPSLAVVPPTDPPVAPPPPPEDVIVPPPPQQQLVAARAAAELLHQAPPHAVPSRSSQTHQHRLHQQHH